MESFEVIIKEEQFRIIRNSLDNSTFSVFNYATCHIIKKNELGKWNAIEHRFGTDTLPMNEIGEAIDSYYNSWQIKAGEMPGTTKA